MARLTADERDLLGRIVEKPELQPFFFRKAKGLKWFDALSEKGFFRAENNPPPTPSQEKGYVNIPFWPAAEYLVSASDELKEKQHENYAEQFLEIIRTATAYAKKNQFSNYRTWWQFSKVIQNIPPSLVKTYDINIIDYWLNDPYDRSLIATEIGSKWLVSLLDRAEEHSRELALGLIEMLFKLEVAKPNKSGESRKAALRFDDWHAKKISESVASKAGRALGIAAARVFQNRLETLLLDENSDKWSSVWRRAIEDHEQDQYARDANSIIVSSYRDCLLAFHDADPDAGRQYVDALLKSSYDTIRRIAIYAINQRFGHLRPLLDQVIHNAFFTSNFQHELWHLLNKHYNEFFEHERERVIRIILTHVEHDKDGNVHKGASSYWRAIWLAAIKDSGTEVAKLYAQSVKDAGSEPEHPDFSSYMRAGFVTHKSPYSLEELLALSVDALVERLNSYQDPGDFFGPGIQGLAKTIRQLIKTEPLRYSTHLDQFLSCDLAYIYELLEAYHELWSQNVALPWNDVWFGLLTFSQQLVGQFRFWDPQNAQRRSSFVANRYWIVGTVARLIEDGVKSDEHAFSDRFLAQAEDIILVLLKNEQGEEFKSDSDAVSIAINSPRGRALEALINLTLRCCRIADKVPGNHTDVWKHFESIFAEELKRADNNEFEFVTLVANYLPNFLYMSKDWTLSNLERIFDQTNQQKWRCAMQGYAHVNNVYEGVYRHLREHGDFIRALDDEKVSDRVQEKVIQNIVVGFLSDYDALSDNSGPLCQLVLRKRHSELSHLIWFVWTLRDTHDQKVRGKVFELWRQINAVIDTTIDDDKKLASKLCTWIAFIDDVSESNKHLILDIAPYADESHNAYEILEGIARISDKYPIAAYEIWLRVLEGSRPDFPDEAIRQSLRNLVKHGADGLRNAKRIVDQYIKGGNERPAEMLTAIISERA